MVEAFERLILEELGKAVTLASAPLLGVSEHIYPDSVSGEGASTHYVVIAHELTVTLDTLCFPRSSINSFVGLRMANCFVIQMCIHTVTLNFD